jgi:undecaprenyl-diphosphatase
MFVPLGSSPDTTRPSRGGTDPEGRDMNYLEAVILGIVEGLTEFLPVSSTGHLTITEKILGLPIDDDGVTAYTAVIQMGAIAAVLVYFFKDIVQIAAGWFRGLFKPELRGSLDHRMGWYVIVGSIPIGIVGFLGKDVISGPLRSLWWVGGSLVFWCAVMVFAEKVGRQDRSERDLTMLDSILVGLVQCVALVPGVSRSGATISGGLLRGLDRVTATRLSFFLSIPALLAAGLYELKDALGGDIGIGQTIVGTLVSFVVAYASVAWLLRFVAGHSIGKFVPYRVGLGLLLIVALSAGWITAT